MYTDQPQGIAGLRGREPVGAALTVGIKDPKRGFPIEKDRFHIVWPNENPEGRRPHHPSFQRFNGAPAERRGLVLGDLVHARREECFEFSYRAQKAPGQPSHPAKVPFCVGNGVDAKRYDGSQFNAIACPGEQCEFRQADGKKPSPCKPWMRFLFRVRWQTEVGMPTPLCKYTSGGWNTIKNFVGFFDHIESTAASLGLDDYSLIGFPIALQIQERTNAATKSRFPVVTVTPLMDLVSFFDAQLDRRARIAAREPIAALTDQAERTAASRDHANHMPGLVPGGHEDPWAED